MRNKTNLSLLALGLLLTSLLATTACMSSVSAGRQVADSEITASVKTRLAADPDVAAINIDVDTLEGVVTLSGLVKSQDERAEAEELARGTEHVKKVINNLKVGDHS
jgi:hyperosmotically inducible protein